MGGGSEVWGEVDMATVFHHPCRRLRRTHRGLLLQAAVRQSRSTAAPLAAASAKRADSWQEGRESVCFRRPSFSKQKTNELTTSVEAAAPQEPAHVAIEEKLHLTMKQDMSIDEMDVKRSLSLISAGMPVRQRLPCSWITMPSRRPLRQVSVQAQSKRWTRRNFFQRSAVAEESQQGLPRR